MKSRLESRNFEVSSRSRRYDVSSRSRSYDVSVSVGSVLVPALLYSDSQRNNCDVNK